MCCLFSLVCALGRQQEMFLVFIVMKGALHPQNLPFHERKETVFALFEDTIRGAIKVQCFGEVDGRDAKHEHLALKIIRYATNTLNLWKEESCEFFWDCVSGNVPNLVLGTRTDTIETNPKTRDPLCYPELSAYKLAPRNIGGGIEDVLAKLVDKQKNVMQWISSEKVAIQLKNKAVIMMKTRAKVLMGVGIHSFEMNRNVSDNFNFFSLIFFHYYGYLFFYYKKLLFKLFHLSHSKKF
ncbi:Protein CBG14030 [Caenorhabditis briggsae]|uniref:Protein CBG14030 n=1 Tax=Caenorhabditis briggsae TaxID=6238 RepID=A8XJ77_CAEBR|nr:Protein CBG14030 [Caenorhabditis briggsae]CAP32702.2 Protein CBG14030 [Caenorhabditis briggsae]